MTELLLYLLALLLETGSDEPTAGLMAGGMIDHGG
jgi:hypothetical protein